MFINLDSKLFKRKVKFSVAFSMSPASTAMLSDQVALKSPDGTAFTITKAEAARSPFISAAVEKLISTTPTEIPLSNVPNKALEIVVHYLKGPADADINSEVSKKFAEEFLSKLNTGDLYDLASSAVTLQVEGLRLLATAEIEKRKSAG